ncbi:lysylphosphatidylglycerol synthase domain-containing protein [Pseudanabaena sp. FACHB-2040]|uniref:lysylphosphatidylglycerol synthase domain-containing protein n=1 Tax=Pseudanabaena sp. FACHB-2040 TaxID=2692859 RepID=UPI0016857686|nr:lysylphosphatidylglycerol synthase domain-containing protein [Pseudanabaena sp. FACHB-2040]MBD2256521.1 UPF0104 family protein [Pseudanabaena sp. FACHB-2040]
MRPDTDFLRTPLAKRLKQFSQFAPALFSLGLFCLSAWAIHSELSQYPPRAILNNIRSIPVEALGAAVALTGLNFLFLTGNDTLATRYVRHPLPYRKTALVAVISYAISNSVGMAMLSGGAIRYRFYSAWGLSAGKVAQIAAFCGLSFWIGLFFLCGLVFTLDPLPLPGLLHLPFETVRPIGLLFLAMIAAYLTITGLNRHPVKIGRWSLPNLPLKLSLAQILVTSGDWAAAAGVIYVLLWFTGVSSGLSYFAFFGAYLLALLSSIISNVPGGLGVFETVLLLLISPPIAADSLLGVLLVYRIIYFFLPLIVGVLLLGVYELQQRYRRS